MQCKESFNAQFGIYIYSSSLHKLLFIFFNSMSLMKQPTSISCAHMFCKQCIETKMQQKSTCPLCNHLIKQLHPMPNIQIIIDEFMKLKQEYQVDDPFIDPASLCKNIKRYFRNMTDDKLQQQKKTKHWSHPWISKKVLLNISFLYA